MREKITRWAIVIIASIFIVGLVRCEANAQSSMRYRPTIMRPVPRGHTDIHIHNHTDHTARNIAITAVVIGVVALVVATCDNSPRTTGNSGYDRYLAGERPAQWQKVH